MKLREFYQRAIAIGIENDPRGKGLALKDLEAKKKDFDSLKDDEKDFIDRESLNNPYADSRILSGTGEEDIRNILVGIDIEVGEVLLCERLKEKGTGRERLRPFSPR